MKVDNTIVGSFRGFRNLGLFGILFCLIGCSGEQIDGPGNEPQPSTEQAIAFSAGLPEQQEITRSTPLEEELPVGQKTFKVWGFKNDAYDSGTGSYTSYQTVFPGYNVNWAANTAATTTSNTHDWEYVGQQGTGDPAQTIKYWDWSAKAYRYFAVTNYEETKPATLVAGKIYNESFGTDEYQFTMLADVTDIAAAPFFSRMWFSTGNAVTYPDKQFGDPVVLEFTKPFARVRFMFTFTEDGVTRTNIASKSFKPVANPNPGIPQSGDVIVHYPLKGEKTSEYYSIANVGTTLTEFDKDWYTSSDTTDPDREHWYTVLPSGDQGAYILTITIFGDDKTAVVPANFMQWKPGYEYTYRFKVNEAGGITLDVIQVGINDWEIKNDSYHTVYNW
ncbi:MAG: fimbrillin family protein [Bacteroidaceae bacterium]|nr:fimbrillin family protein [Bacteroidaceae bacterium]